MMILAYRGRPGRGGAFFRFLNDLAGGRCGRRGPCGTVSAWAGMWSALCLSGGRRNWHPSRRCLTGLGCRGRRSRSIGGEAGVGKTRLTRELAELAAGQGFCVLTGQCVELGGEGLPLAPLVDALRTLAKTMPPDALASVLGPAAAPLSRLLPELAQVMAAAAAGSAGAARAARRSCPAGRRGHEQGAAARARARHPRPAQRRAAGAGHRRGPELGGPLHPGPGRVPGQVGTAEPGHAHGDLPVGRTAPQAPAAPAADQLGAGPVHRAGSTCPGSAGTRWPTSSARSSARRRPRA